VDTVAQYQRYAREWRERARTATSEHQREACEQLADEWDRLANEVLALVASGGPVPPGG
jgi:hypothetical protein